jgi:DNA invertase Pin-like site-specific DNA recombinase
VRVGYARVSTTEQSLESQLERLSHCGRVFSEKWSGAKQDRKQLEDCLAYVREGDTLVVTRLDRLARSVSHLCAIADTLSRKGVSLVVLDQAIDTTTPTGKLLFHMLAAIAEFELGIRKEAQRAGMAHARATGKVTGRPTALDEAERRHIAALIREGFGVGLVARKYNISKSTVRRYARIPVTSDAT